MSKLISICLISFGLSHAAFIGVGNNVIEAGLSLGKNIIGFGYSLEIVPDERPSFFRSNGPIYINNFLLKYCYTFYNKNGFSVSAGAHSFYSIGFKESSYEERLAKLIFAMEPEYMVTDRFAVFGTCNLISYYLVSPMRLTDYSINLVPQVNVGFRIKLGPIP